MRLAVAIMGVSRSRGRLVNSGEDGTHVRSQLEVGSTPANVGIVRVVEMAVEDLLGRCKRAVESEQCAIIISAGSP